MRRLKKVGIYLLVFVAASVVGILVMDRAGGEIPAGVYYEYPELTDSENAAFLYRAAWSALEATPEGADKETLRLLKKYNDFRLARAGVGDGFGEPLSAMELEKLPLIFAKAEPAFALLHQARATKGCLFLEDHSAEAAYANIEQILETSQVTRFLARYLIARALWEAEQGNIDAALDWMVTGFHFANDLGDESVLIAELVRKTIGFRMLAAVQGILYDHGVSEPIPQALLDEIDDLRDRRHHGDSLRRTGALSGTMMQLQGRWWFPLQSTWQRNYLETLAAFIEAIEVDEHAERLSKMRQVWSSIAESGTGIKKYLHYYDSLIVPPLFPDEAILESLIATADLVELGLFLRAYEQAYGAFPDALAELTPEYLAAIPEDPLNGKEYFYETSGARATIRSEKLTKRGAIAIHLAPTALDASTL